MTAATLATPKTNILIVEDEGLIACDIQAVLEQLGYNVSGLASSGAEAIEMASLIAADLVLMDIKIRGEIDGIETAQLIRQRFQLPVIYLTAHADTATVDRAKATEPFGYVVKPFTKSDIKVAIEMALARHKLQKQLEEKEAWFSTVLRSIGDAIVATDCDGNIKFLNSAAESLTGWPSEEARSRPFSDVIRLLDDSGSDQVLEAAWSSSLSQTAHFSTGTLNHRDGSQHLVISSIAPIRTSGNAMTHGAVIVLREISDLKKTEQALRETNWFLTGSNAYQGRIWADAEEGQGARFHLTLPSIQTASES